VRETLATDIPLAADHFRYLAGETRALKGTPRGQRGQETDLTAGDLR
jgi:acyl-CoA reductase-like NAD-dependent aldehyde dehydrogenase